MLFIGFHKVLWWFLRVLCCFFYRFFFGLFYKVLWWFCLLLVFFLKPWALLRQVPFGEVIVSRVLQRVQGIRLCSSAPSVGSAVGQVSAGGAGAFFVWGDSRGQGVTMFFFFFKGKHGVIDFLFFVLYKYMLIFCFTSCGMTTNSFIYI